MGFKSSDPWGNDQLTKSSGLLKAVLINSFFVAIFFIFSMMYSFLQMPMFGDEVDSSPLAIIISALTWTFAFDIIAIWRAVKLSKVWSLSNCRIALLWVYQIGFIVAVGLSNFWMMIPVRFWLDKL